MVNLRRRLTFLGENRTALAQNEKTFFGNINREEVYI